MAKLENTHYSWRQTPLRRTFQVATSRIVLAPLLIVSMIGAGVLFYYYNRYAQIIDAGLRGDIFVRSSGIYAAPLTLHDGSVTRMDSLITHLRNIGYLERGGSQNDRRGQYIRHGNVIEIYPGTDAQIDGGKAFRNLRVVYGRDGSVIQTITDLDTRQQLAQAEVEPELISSIINQEREKRKIIEYKDLPQNLVDAIISIEDQQFFEHPGVNWRGILRALIRDYQAGELREGGSSITQQLVKNFFLKPDRTFKRKLSEAYMSLILEQRLRKSDIMAMYCNQIYLGQRGGFSINGFGQAARAYFGKDISNLSLGESAFLAGIIRSPNYYSPYGNEERARDRRNFVLQKMVEAQQINQAEADSAKRQPLVVTSKVGGVDALDAPYFVDFLMRQLESQFGDGGQSLRSLRIYSTIDLELQRAAYQAVSQKMVEVEKLFARRKGGTVGLQAALVAMNAKTGDILAMVGGRDYATSQLNRATEAKRQPGSVFKPFVYATALSLGADDLNGAITPASMFMDAPRTFEFDGKLYDPGNFGDKYEMRPITVRDALVNSKNVVTVEIAERIGFSQIVRLADKAGLAKMPPYPSVALGVGEATPMQMASAYTTFANQGKRVAPIAIKRVTTKDGATVFESKPESREVISPQVAYIMTSMMRDVLDHGTGTRVRQMGFTGIAAGKTGSSRDGWFAGYTPNLVCVVWVGFDDNSDIRLTGGVTAAPIWGDFMIRALRARPELGGDFREPPEGLVSYDIDPATGTAVQSGAINVRHEIFLQGTQPGERVMPESQPPDSDSLPPTADGETARPTPIPRTPTAGTTVPGSNNDNFIPLPPEARRRMSKENPQPASEPQKRPRSFFRKLTDAVGITSSPSKIPDIDSSAGSPGDDRAAKEPNRGAGDAIPLPPEVRRAPRPNSNSGPLERTSESVTIARPTPTPGHVGAPPPSLPPQDNTFLLDVCSVSGLLPVSGVCEHTVRRRFTLGREPTTFCSKARHKGKSQ